MRLDRQTTNSEDTKDGELVRARHVQSHEDPERQSQDQHIREYCERRLNDVEAVVDAHRVRVIPQSRCPVRTNREALEQGTKENSKRVGCVDEHQSPDDQPDGTVVSSETEKEDQHGGFHEGENWVVAELLEEVPPEAGAGVEVFGHLVVFPAIVVELQDFEDVSDLARTSWMRCLLTHK